MSDDPNEKELPEDEEEAKASDEETSSNGDADSSGGPESTEAEEIELKPVGSDEGPGDDSEGASGRPSDLLGKGKLSEKEDKTFGMLAHLLGAFTSFIGPLVIWLIKKDDSPFVDDQGKESVNFQITIGIAYLVWIGVSVIPILGCFTTLLGPVIWVGEVVFSILGCIKANEGQAYRYPCALRLIK